MTEKKYETTLEAFIPLRQPVVHQYTTIEWREDGPYDAETGERVAVISSPRKMRPKKKVEGEAYVPRV